MTENNRTIGEELHDLNNKIDSLRAEVALMHLELKGQVIVNDTRLNQHDRDLSHAFEDIHKLEDRSWRTGGAILLGTVSFIGTAALALLTFLL